MSLEPVPDRPEPTQAHALGEQFITFVAVLIATLLVGIALGGLALVFVWVWSAVIEVAQ